MNHRYVRMLASISLGLFFGAVLGAALHTLGVGSDRDINVGVGMALGVSLGIVLGAALDIAPGAASASKATVSNKPLPRPLGL